MAYIAPEVFFRNLGNVCYKSDVHCFGMVLLAIVGGRKNTDDTAENTGQVYFPEWIYNCLDGGEELRLKIQEACRGCRNCKETCDCRILVHSVAPYGSSLNEN